MPSIPHRVGFNVVALVACVSLTGCGAAGSSPKSPGSGGSPTSTGVEPTQPESPAGHVQTSVPGEATLDSGADPFVDAKPDECDRARGVPGEPDFALLRDLDQVRADNPIPGDGLTSQSTLITNAAGQSFDVIATGSEDGAAIESFIAETSICLEAMPIANAPIVREPVRLDRIVVTIASDLTGKSVPELAQQRDGEVVAGHAGSLADVISTFAIDPAEVLAAAVTRAEAEVAGAVDAGQLTAVEAADADLGELLGALLSEAEAPFLVDPGRLAEDETKYADVIAQDPRQTVVVTLQPVETKVEDALEVVWFVIDPPINAGRWRYYRAKCQYWASLAINASKGSATAYLWGYSPWIDVGSKTGVGGNGWSPWLTSPSSASRRTFDVSVYGRQNESYYDLAGGWVEDAGGGC